MKSRLGRYCDAMGPDGYLGTKVNDRGSSSVFFAVTPRAQHNTYCSTCRYFGSTWLDSIRGAFSMIGRYQVEDTLVCTPHVPARLSDTSPPASRSGCELGTIQKLGPWDMALASVDRIWPGAMVDI